MPFLQTGRRILRQDIAKLSRIGRLDYSAGSSAERANAATNSCGGKLLGIAESNKIAPTT